MFAFVPSRENLLDTYIQNVCTYQMVFSHFKNYQGTSVCQLFLVKAHFNLKNFFMSTAVIYLLKLHGKFKFFNDSYFVVTEEEIYSESSFDTYLQATILAMHKRVALYYVVIA